MTLIRSRYFLGLCLLLFYCNSYATNYVCPTTYQTIMTGYTMDQVRTACGEPAQTSTQTLQANTPTRSEQWIYTLPNVVAQKIPAFSPQLMITFDNDKVAEIAVNNQSANALFYCYRSGNLKFGISKNDVVRQCGAPTYVNVIQRAGSTQEEVTRWVYNFGRYQPQIIVIFKEGSVNSITTGMMGN